MLYKWNTENKMKLIIVITVFKKDAENHFIANTVNHNTTTTKMATVVGNFCGLNNKSIAHICSPIPADKLAVS